MLESKGIKAEIVHYLDTPPSVAELEGILVKLGMQAEQIVRKGEALYKELGLHEKTLSNDEWIETLVANPKLIERPIVVNGNMAAIGRPIENVINIL
jgi:arsenate reductase